MDRNIIWEKVVQSHLSALFSTGEAEFWSMYFKKYVGQFKGMQKDCNGGD